VSLFLDVQFLNEISYRLDKFARKGDYLFNCRCPYCGDSKTNANKTRGYLFKSKNHLNFKCHNCGKSTSFSKLLEHLDQSAYKRYKLEEFKETHPNYKSNEVVKPMAKSAKRLEMEQRIDVRFPFLQPVHESPDAVAYLKGRLIPERFHNLFYYVAKTRFLNALSDKYTGKWKTDEPRLVIPFYDVDHKLVGVNCRALDDKAKSRYLIAKLEDDAELIFGIDRVDFSQHAIVVEGPIDSLFLDNAIAAGGTALDKALKYFEKDQITLVFDNQPRNADVVRIINKAVENGFKVCIWPAMVLEKDINDMIKAGKTSDYVQDLINMRTYQGLAAKMKFNEWRKIDD